MALDVKNYDPARMYGAVDSLGATAYTGAVTMSSTLAVTGVATFTAAPVFSAGPITRRNVLASSGNTTVTTAMSGALLLIDGAGTDFTLPAIAAGDVGVFFDFVSTAVSTSQSVTAGAADLLVGGMVMVDEATPLVDAFHPDVSDDLIFATNGTTTGGLVGSTYRFTAISATRWWVEGINYGSGTLATPFA